MHEWELVYYETVSGDSPVEDYIARLPEKEQARAYRGLDILEALGTRAGMPDARPISGTLLWELRIRGRNHHRIFYIAIHRHRILLLHVFAKKTEKTPQREIATAERRLRDYLDREIT